MRWLVVALTLALAAGQSAPWPMFGATAANTRAGGEAAWSTSAGPGGFGLLWTFSTSGKVVGSAALGGAGANLTAFIGSEVRALRDIV